MHRSTRPSLSRGLVPVVALAALALLAARPAAAAYTDCIQLTAPVSPPLTISTPGVYCLVDDLDVTLTSGVALQVLADDVTLDLNGHFIRNHATSPGSSYGLYLVGERIEVRGGTVAGFQRGVFSDCDGASGHLLERLHLDGSGFMGALLQCDGTVFRRNVVTGTGSGNVYYAYGVSVTGARNQVVDNTVTSTVARTRSIGIAAGSGATANLVVENRITTADRGVDTFGLPAELRCRDNVTIDVVSGYPGCTDLGNNH